MAEGALLRPKMKEHASSNYLGRTRRNVVDSHMTLIITNTYPLMGGTLWRVRAKARPVAFYERFGCCRIGRRID